MKARMKRTVAAALIAVLIGSAGFLYESDGFVPREQVAQRDALAEAFQHRASDVQVEAAGVVTRLLPDDTDGSRHQRFIVRLPSGQTLLISHNIDVAPRIEGLTRGDEVSFRGEYEWNDKGGVVHWTHHDPAGRRVGGWIRHDGKMHR